MIKSFLLILLMAIIGSSIITCMEQELSTSETNQPESEWAKLTYEIQKIILTYATLGRAKSFSQVLEKLNALGEKSIFSNNTEGEDFIVDLAKKYIAKRKKEVKSPWNVPIELSDFVQEVYSENIPAIKALIKAGVDVNSYIGPEDTILMLAVRRNCQKAVPALIDAGANVDGQNGWNDTPLIVATLQGNQEMVKILVDAGADVNAENNHGTAEIFAEQLGFTEITEILHEAAKKQALISQDYKEIHLGIDQV